MPLTATHVGYDYSAGTEFEQPAVRDVSLSVDRGELLLVIGSTGSGKSTLLRMLAGLLMPSAGSLSIDDARLTPKTARGAVGLVFQDAESQLFAETVADDVAFGPRNLGVQVSEIDGVTRQALSAVGLDPESYGPRSPFGLSGGEARRVAIAGVLAMRPRYLLLDEPTAALDARGRAAVRAIVRGIRRSAGVVVVSHSPEEFLGEADRVIMLRSGEAAFAGTGFEAVSQPASFASAGLSAPDVLQVLACARESGLHIPDFTLDPDTAADLLVAAGAWST